MCLEAALLPLDAAPLPKHDESSAEKVQEPDTAAEATISSTTSPTPLEHKLQLSYTFNDEAVTSSAITPTAGAVSADGAALESILKLNCSSSQQVVVTEALIHAISSSNAALPILLTASSRLTSNAAATDPAAAAAPPAAAAKPAKPGKAPPAPEEIPWQPDQLCTLSVDLAAILVGDTELICAWPQKGLVLPPQLQAYSRIQLRIQVLHCTKTCLQLFSKLYCSNYQMMCCTPVPLPLSLLQQYLGTGADTICRQHVRLVFTVRSVHF